jgi:hypothetical protein
VKDEAAVKDSNRNIDLFLSLENWLSTMEVFKGGEQDL